jgi:hypothetical protein
VGIRTYWIWGKGRNAIEVQLLAARANEAMTRTAAAQDRANHDKELAAKLTAAAKDREQDRANHDKELAAKLTAAAKDREQDRANHDKQLSTVRECYHRARAEAMWRSLSVSRTDWHDSLHCLTDGRLARKMD